MVHGANMTSDICFMCRKNNDKYPWGDVCSKCLKKLVKWINGAKS
jgi:hypothetical protein